METLLCAGDRHPGCWLSQRNHLTVLCWWENEKKEMIYNNSLNGMANCMCTVLLVTEILHRMSIFHRDV